MALRSKFRRVMILGFVFSLGVALTANAGFTLTLTTDDYKLVNGQLVKQGTITATISDNQFDSLNDGSITFVDFMFGDFLFTGTFATSNASSMSSPATLTLSQASIRNSDRGDRTLTITVQDTGFYVPAGPVRVDTELFALDMSHGGSVSSYSLVDGVQAGDTVTRTGAGYSISSGNTNTTNLPYTLTNVTTVTLGRGGYAISNGGTTVSPVASAPAPASVVMALAGAPVLGLFGWLRGRRNPVREVVA